MRWKRVYVTVLVCLHTLAHTTWNSVSPRLSWALPKSICANCTCIFYHYVNNWNMSSTTTTSVVSFNTKLNTLKILNKVQLEKFKKCYEVSYEQDDYKRWRYNHKYVDGLWLSQISLRNRNWNNGSMHFGVVYAKIMRQDFIRSCIIHFLNV